MHLRKLPSFRPPARILQAVLVASEPELLEAFGQLHARAGNTGGGTRYLTWREGAMSVAWERHTEFMTITFIWECDGETADFDFEGMETASALLLQLPGQIIRGNKVRFLGRDHPHPDSADLAKSFAADDLISSDVAEGRARVWSDFRLNADGFGRLLIADLGLERGEPALLVQRLQELGNYRKMALLGLPVAQTAATSVSALERRLTNLTREIAAGAATDDTILADLLDLSAELARLGAETRHRMSATRAYAQLCAERIRQLKVRAILGYRSLEDFTERRLAPAVRTCEAFTARLEDLSRQAAWASALLRTRIDTRLSGQQRDLLASMDRRTDLQLRLQNMVEWISAAAVAYYLVGLLHYALAPFPAFAGLSKDTTLAIAAPAVLAAVVVAMNLFHRRSRRAATAALSSSGTD